MALDAYRLRFSSLGLLVLAVVACGDAADDDADAYTADECNNARDQLMDALEQNVSSGVLLPEAIPCGEEGIANRPDYFDERVAPRDVEYLQESFGDACQTYEAKCSRFDDEVL